MSFVRYRHGLRSTCTLPLVSGSTSHILAVSSSGQLEDEGTIFYSSSSSITGSWTSSLVNWKISSIGRPGRFRGYSFIDIYALSEALDPSKQHLCSAKLGICSYNM